LLGGLGAGANLWTINKQTGKAPDLAGPAAFLACGTALATGRKDRKQLSRNDTGIAMDVTKTTKATIRAASHAPVENAIAAPADPSRALVALTPATGLNGPLTTSYRQAAFLAHLIAVKDQVPQTRERRRAEPGEALAAYRAAGALTR
jgi:hypothetical protein